MDQTRPCGCKGRRSCLICEEQFNIEPPSVITPSEKENGYVYCHLCEAAWKGWDESCIKEHPNHRGDKIDFPGVFIINNFLDDSEKERLLEGIRSDQWTLSQSGRRKQNYGPKCNFKKMKIQNKGFFGFPKYSKFVHDKFKKVELLNTFDVIEQCVLEYDPARGASIDPHIDDCWIWGERIITVNVIGDTFLTMTQFKGDKTKYNLNCLESYDFGADCKLNDMHNFVVRIFMPEKSLIVLTGSARYEWEHCVLREDINHYRLCIAYREFTPPYLMGEFREIGDEIRAVGKQFW